MPRHLTLFAVSTMMLIAAADPEEGGHAVEGVRAPVPGVGSTYFVVPPEHAEAAELTGDDAWSTFWGEMEGGKGEDDLAVLRRARVAAAGRALELVEAEFGAGTATAEDRHRVGRELMRARLEEAQADAERLSSWEEYLPHVRAWELDARAAQQFGGLTNFTPMDASLIRAERFAAEVEVLKLRRKVFVAAAAEAPPRGQAEEGVEPPGAPPDCPVSASP